MAISAGWVEKMDALRDETVSPNEANTSSDVFSSETIGTPGGRPFPERSQLGREDGSKRNQPQMTQMN
jgi:hypothetical protein